MYKVFYIFLVVLFFQQLSCIEEKKSYNTEKSGIIVVNKDNYKKLSKDDWLKILSPEEYNIIWEKGTEKAHTGKLLKEEREGIFFSKALKLPIFATKHKFNSGTGWPSFVKPLVKENIKHKKDFKFGWIRTEVLTKYDEHLGHVFKDGPKDRGGLRYCLNSASLTFVPYDDLSEEHKKLYNDAER